MKEWEKELYILQSRDYPQDETPSFQSLVMLYLTQGEEKYFRWMLHSWEKNLNDIAMGAVQNYAMFGHFIDFKMTAVTGILQALNHYDPTREVPFEAFMKDMPEGTKAKAEVNVYGYVDKEAGKNVEHNTMQVTFKKQPVMTGTETIAWFAQKYPILGTLGIPAETVVSMPTSKYIISYAIEIGELKRGDTKLEVEACVWCNKDTGEFVTAEVSWRADLKDADASYELFDAIQHKAPEILDAGKSKNACIK